MNLSWVWKKKQHNFVFPTFKMPAQVLKIFKNWPVILLLMISVHDY